MVWIFTPPSRRSWREGTEAALATIQNGEACYFMRLFTRIRTNTFTILIGAGVLTLAACTSPAPTPTATATPTRISGSGILGGDPDFDFAVMDGQGY